MATVSDVIVYFEEFAPAALSEDWDNVGLLVGHRDATVERVITCLTLTPDVAAEAVSRDVQLVISHHPVLFRGVKQITDATEDGRLILSLIEHRIAVFSPHTCFDSASEGINRQLAESFGLTEIKPIREHEWLKGVGSGRVGKLRGPVVFGEFLEAVRIAVQADYVEFAGAKDAMVTGVAVACGSAAEFLADAISLGCDTFVTGEASFHRVLQACAARMNLILLGHYCSERPAVERLADILATKFPNLDVWASLEERDPLSVFTT